mgnify:CR=1 FL=1
MIKHTFDSLFIYWSELSVVDRAKNLGLAISKDRTWNHHVKEVIKKANKRIFSAISQGGFTCK